MLWYLRSYFWDVFLLFDWKFVVSVRAYVSFPVRESLKMNLNDYEFGAF